MRRFLTALFAVLLGMVAAAGAARAASITVDLSSQTMQVQSGAGDYVWPISSARSGYVTPRGTYGVQRLEVLHRSHKYHNSPMPHSIFFHGGYAIHGTYATGALGRPASHGCIRIAPGNAAALYEIVRAEGARITIVGSAPQSRSLYASRTHHRDYALARHSAPDLRGGYDDPSGALGYQQVPDTTLNHWWLNPAGF